MGRFFCMPVGLALLALAPGCGRRAIGNATSQSDGAIAADANGSDLWESGQAGESRAESGADIIERDVIAMSDALQPDDLSRDIGADETVSSLVDAPSGADRDGREDLGEDAACRPLAARTDQACKFKPKSFSDWPQELRDGTCDPNHPTTERCLMLVAETFCILAPRAQPGPLTFDPQTQSAFVVHSLPSAPGFLVRISVENGRLCGRTAHVDIIQDRCEEPDEPAVGAIVIVDAPGVERLVDHTPYFRELSGPTDCP